MIEDSASRPIATGRVLQVSVSGGGVPKTPVERAWVGLFGINGDDHDEKTVHGGPHRAVCLFAMEAIERIQSEGHPIEPGAAGENLTTAGIEWSLLPVGTRARIGDQLEIELASSTTPCATQKPNFRDGNFNRILIDRHPSDSRMYARVLRQGEVKPGDAVVVLPPATDSRALEDLLLKRLDRADLKSATSSWKAARDAGFAIQFVEDGEVALCAAPEIPGPAFNQALGFARLPNLLGMATSFFDKRQITGSIWLEDQAPWTSDAPDLTLSIYGAHPTDIVEAPLAQDVVIRRLGADEGARYAQVSSGSATAGGVAEGGLDPWPRVYEGLARNSSRQLFIAEIGGRPVGNGSLHISGRTGWMRGATVAPEARGRGLQRALIAARARAAVEAGCDLVGASAEPDYVSSRNLELMGMRPLGTRLQYRYVPGTWRP